jgi:hypothetical protein
MASTGVSVETNTGVTEATPDWAVAFVVSIEGEGVGDVDAPDRLIDCTSFPGSWQAKRKRIAARMKPVKRRSVLKDISSPTAQNHHNKVPQIVKLKRKQLETTKAVPIFNDPV